jgi:hypothetical protein
VEGLRVSELWLLIATFLLVGSIFLFRRVGGLGTVLRLVGATALFLLKVFEFSMSWIGRYGYDLGLGDPIVLLRSLKNVEIPANIVGFLSLFFPIGFLVYALRTKPQPSNQPMQPTAGRRTERLKDEL